MFIANTGEEQGLLGADYFAAHPTVPIGKIVGVVDLDMPLLLYEFTDVIAFGADHSTVAKAVADAGAAMGISVSPDPMPRGIDLRPIRPLPLRPARRAGDPADHRLCQWRQGTVEEFPRQGLSFAAATT